MGKEIYTREKFNGNNTLNSIIIRVDFLTLKIESILEEFLQILGDRYSYRKIDNYDINLEISDPERLITQDFIKRSVNLENTFEFRKKEEDFKFIIGQNFFLYERNEFESYKGSTEDINEFLELLKKIFEKGPRMQRIGVRKTNILYIEKDTEALKKIIDNPLVSNLDNSINHKFNFLYTPLYENNKDGYNLVLQLDYGKMRIDDGDKDVYRYIIDIDSYIRNINSIDDYSKIERGITTLKNNDFKIYKDELTEDFLKIMILNDKTQFTHLKKEIGILNGVNYGKH